MTPIVTRSLLAKIAVGGSGCPSSSAVASAASARHGAGISAGPLPKRQAWLDKFTDVKAMSVIPGHPGSELVAEVPEPPPGQGSVLVEGLLAGICGTDTEILHGGGQPPAGGPRLVIGHESLGRVLEAPADAPVRPGDLVAGVVRRPDPVPCPACAVARPDFCVNGRYTERGIKGLDGYGATRWRVSPRFAVPVPDELGDLGVLTEPGSVVAKAWEQIDRLALRAPAESSSGRIALITGAGPIGMLAALLGRQRGYQVHIFDRVTAGPKPALVAALGATYHHGPAGALELCPDVVLECTGAGELVLELAGKLAPAGVMCLIGISSGQRRVPVDMSRVGASMVLGNTLVFGTVSAARCHYEQAVGALARADPAWLGALITRRVPLSGWQPGLARQPGDVKVVVDLTQ
jgi:glucose 1-dehydrogenase